MLLDVVERKREDDVLEKVQAAMKKCADSRLRKLSDTVLFPLIATAISCDIEARPRQNGQSIGLAWVYVGLI